MKLPFVSMVALLLVITVGDCGRQSNAATKKGNGGTSFAPSSLVVTGPGRPGTTWKPVASLGQSAAWICDQV
jgi:hypothetical protein